jgi:hypothetical protein
MEQIPTPVQETHIAVLDPMAKLLSGKRSENTKRAYKKDLADFFRT